MIWASPGVPAAPMGFSGGVAICGGYWLRGLGATANAEGRRRAWCLGDALAWPRRDTQQLTEPLGQIARAGHW